MSGLETKLQPLTGQRQKGESDNAVIACNDWLRMGSGRRLIDVINNYQQLSTFSASFAPPTLSDKTLRTWSSNYNWASRASEYDAAWEQRKNEEREQVFGHELALDFERVRKLTKLATLLEAQIYELSLPNHDGIETLHNVWLRDVKQIGRGDDAERVDIERFNGNLISEYRAVLDDIAKEVGGRAKKTEVTGKDGGAIEHKDISLDDDERLARIATIFERARTRRDSESS